MTNTELLQAEFRRRWLKLFSNAVIPAVVQHPAWLEAMFDELSDMASDICLVKVFDDSPGSDALIALAALRRMRLAQGFLLPVTATWDSGFLFSGTPLLDASAPKSALLQLIKAAGQKTGAKSVLFRKVPFDGPFATAIDQLVQAGEIKMQAFDAHERAALLCQLNFADWYRQNFSTKRRKEYRRLHKRLEELGDIQIKSWQAGEPLQPWIDKFLELEAAGWKGKRGTAIACDAKQAKFIDKAFKDLAAAGHLMFWRIDLDSEPIATLFALANDRQVWLGKMAYNEDLAQYSPGVMVILEATREILDSRQFVWADSAADAHHPMIDNIWRDRIEIGDMLVSVPGAAKPYFAATVCWEKLRRGFRGTAKIIYHKIRRR